MYRIELFRFEHPPVRSAVEDPSAVLALVGSAAPVSSLLIADIRDGADRGNFIIWFNDDRACVRLDEHREHPATAPSLRDAPGEPVAFRDDDGSMFEVPFRETVTRDQALQALEHWLRTGDRWEPLAWH